MSSVSVNDNGLSGSRLVDNSNESFSTWKHVSVGHHTPLRPSGPTALGGKELARWRAAVGLSAKIDMTHSVNSEPPFKERPTIGSEAAPAYSPLLSNSAVSGKGSR